MKVGILGSGAVGQSLAAGFLQAGHAVMIGTRDAGKLAGWVQQAGSRASAGSFAEAAAFGNLLVLCCKGSAAEDVLLLAGNDHFVGKVVIDVTNPLLFQKEGLPPTLAVGYPASLGAKVQQLLPESQVVKAFNTVPAPYMANPRLQEGTPDLFIAGNDDQAKTTVRDLAAGWGWTVHDLGGIDQAYLLEALAMLWIRYGFLNNHWTHAFKLLQK
ncbi:MAG: NAD(P)-binding domain-containing protein [Candidatus Aenigmarchaeota archaeon]|nr:NAD(P)-binding domain-containing protein [Candidatus Aenigmarchaeota archaeon]